MLDALKAILDEAVEDEYPTVNPARSKRMRVRVPKPPRTFLEIDELVALEDAMPAKTPSSPNASAGWHHVRRTAGAGRR